MSTIVTIDGVRSVKDQRSDLNANFSNLNTDKLEDAYTDLAAKSKIGTASTQVAAGNYTHTGVAKVTSMTFAAFNTETTSATVQGSNGYTLILLEDSVYDKA